METNDPTIGDRAAHLPVATLFATLAPIGLKLLGHPATKTRERTAPKTLVTRLDYTANEVRMIPSGDGTMRSSTGASATTLKVGGTPRSYEPLQKPGTETGTHEVTGSPYVQADSCTFG